MLPTLESNAYLKKYPDANFCMCIGDKFVGPFSPFQTNHGSSSQHHLTREIEREPSLAPFDLPNKT